MAVKFTKLQNIDLDDSTGTEGEEGDGGEGKEGGKVRLILEEQPNGEQLFNYKFKRNWRWWWSIKHRIKSRRVGRCCWVNSWRTVLIAFVVFFATVVLSLLVSKLAKEPTQEETFLLTQGEYTHTHTYTPSFPAFTNLSIIACRQKSGKGPGIFFFIHMSDVSIERW